MIRLGYVERDLPPAPHVPMWLAWVWRAWHRLAADRQWVAGGMGPPVPGRIPWSVVQMWVVAHGMNRDEATFLDRCLGKMDEVFLEHWRHGQTNAGAQTTADKLARWDDA